MTDLDLDSDLRRREALRRLRTPQPLKAEPSHELTSYILGEEIYVPHAWHCIDCGIRRPAPDTLAVRGSALATARRLTGMYRSWAAVREVLRYGLLPELGWLVTMESGEYSTWPSLCVWCLERDVVYAERVKTTLREARQQEALRRLTG